MSSWIKGIAGAAATGSSGGDKRGGKSGSRSDDSTSPRNSAGFFGKTQDKNKKPPPKQNGNKQEEHPGFKQKMLQYGMDVQSQRDQQRKEQEIIDKKHQKRGQKKSDPNRKADVPNGTSKVKMLSNLVGKSK